MTIPKFKNRQNELITSVDGRKIYFSRSVAVVMVLACMDPDGFYKFLIEKRGNKPDLDSKGKWCLPCGYLDWDESGSDAARRELWEEVGLNLNDLSQYAISGPSMDQPWHVKSEPNENRQNVTLRYGMVIVQKELPKLIPNHAAEPDEVADAVWATYSDIKLGKYDFAFGHDKVVGEFRERYIKS